MSTPTDRELRELNEQVVKEREQRLQTVQELQCEYVQVDISRME